MISAVKHVVTIKPNIKYTFHTQWLQVCSKFYPNKGRILFLGLLRILIHNPKIRAPGVAPSK